MAFTHVNTYIATNLATDTAAILNAWVANFNGARNYYQNGYFSEATVQAAMFTSLVNWLIANGERNNTLVLSERLYPNLTNVADLAVFYNGGQQIYIELKTSFTANDVDADLNILESEMGITGTPMTAGYAFYTVLNGQPGWTQYISQPLNPSVFKVPINVNP